jgi:murein DD-endopeptidase MepM/ murein hydrolase activator NlpD
MRRAGIVAAGVLVILILTVVPTNALIQLIMDTDRGHAYAAGSIPEASDIAGTEPRFSEAFASEDMWLPPLLVHSDTDDIEFITASGFGDVYEGFAYSSGDHQIISISENHIPLSGLFDDVFYESKIWAEHVDDEPEVYDATASKGFYILPANGTLSSRFGPRRISIGSTNHKGIDIGGVSGQPIFAADGGEVIFSGWSDSYGYYIRIRHDNGHVTLYAHCSSLFVRVGERVWQGQQIARMGRTGIATGIHLHFELIINDRQVDPLPHLPEFQ